MLRVLILTHQKGRRWVYRPHLLGGPKAHCKHRNAVNLWQQCFPCWQPSKSSSPNLCPKVPLTEGEREWRTQGRILQGGFAGCQVCLCFPGPTGSKCGQSPPLQEAFSTRKHLFFNSYFGDSQPWFLSDTLSISCVMVVHPGSSKVFFKMSRLFSDETRSS